jgi:hypothetical protein
LIKEAGILYLEKIFEFLNTLDPFKHIMKQAISFLILILVLSSCTKEVQIDIPGYQEQVVIDGSIETDSRPVVLLSNTANVYSPTNLEAYLSSFIAGASITVSDGTTTFTLDNVYTDEMQPADREEVSRMLGFPAPLLASLHMPVYFPVNNPVYGEVGKTYSLSVTYEGKTYTAETTILQPSPLVETFWKPDAGFTDRGFSWAKMADPAGQYDAYHWSVKYLNDPYFTKTFNPVYDDQFFDGLTFDFAYENPMTCNSTYEPEEYRCYFIQNDTIVIKLSKIDRTVYEFMEKKYTQIYSAGNPFATPTNIPTNIQGGALGIWAGYSPWYDTLICVE